MIPGDGSDPEDLQRRLLAGRYSEVRMLFFLGNDILRWVEHCEEFVQHIPELQDAYIRAQSFAALLTANPPENVKSKLLGGEWQITPRSFPEAWACRPCLRSRRHWKF